MDRRRASIIFGSAALGAIACAIVEFTFFAPKPGRHQLSVAANDSSPAISQTMPVTPQEQVAGAELHSPNGLPASPEVAPPSAIASQPETISASPALPQSAEKIETKTASVEEQAKPAANFLPERKPAQESPAIESAEVAVEKPEPAPIVASAVEDSQAIEPEPTPSSTVPMEKTVKKAPAIDEQPKIVAADELPPAPKKIEKTVHQEPAGEPTETVRPPLPAQAVQAEDEEELRLQPQVGWGGAYLGYQQSGAFGGLNCSVTAMDALSIEVKAAYGSWSLLAAVRQFSVDFARDSNNPLLKDSKDFRSISLKPGYGIFYVGVEGRTAPLARLSGSTLDWEDVTSLHGLGGLHLERLYAGRRRKPFLLGLDLEGSIPVAASGSGGPQLSSSSGFGLSLKGYAEKALINGENLRLNFGLEGFGAYDQINLQGTWNGSSGTVKRTIQEYGARTYLKLDF